MAPIPLPPGFDIAEHFLSAIIDSSEDAIVTKDLNGIVTSWNKSAMRIFGYTAAEMIGQPILRLIPDDRKDEEPAILQQLRRGERVEHYETKRLHKNGRMLDISLTISPVKNRAGEIVGASKIARDITKEKRLQQEILDATLREQQRIAQDLHDSICQELAGTEILAQVVKAALEPGTTSYDDMAKVTRNLQAAISHTRMIAHGLSPVNVGAMGLVAALEELAINTRELFRVECVFERGELVLVADIARATHLYRIAQEAISNAVRHGRAQRIILRLSGNSKGARLEIRDDGAGLPESGTTAAGMGMHTMRHRANAIGGIVEVHNCDAGGAVVVCTFDPEA